MRAIVFLVLFATTILVSVSVYSLTRTDQVQDFEKAFQADATKIIESFKMAVYRRLEAIDALSVTITAFAQDTGSTFPNVTISDFEIRCANSRVLSDTAVIQYHPIVTDESRKGWEAYQIEKRGHFEKAFVSELSMIQIQDAQVGQLDDRRLQEAPLLNDKIVSTIGNVSTQFPEPEGSGPYLPMWQFSPVIPTPSILNLNMLSNVASSGAYTETMNSGQAVIGLAANLHGENVGDTGIYWQMVLAMSQYRYGIVEYLEDPLSVVGYPVFDSFNLTTRKVAGVIGTNFYWRLYFQNLLASNSRGIICVMETSRNQAFTYRIDDVVTYMGPGDLHETKYSKYKVTTEISARVSNSRIPSYTTVGLNSDYCTYKVNVYPSQDNEDLYVNNAPVIMTIVIVCVFLFTSIVFVMYTIAVNRRQVVVMKRAVASSAIVSSLFPTQVRGQLYEENQIEPKSSWLHKVTNIEQTPTSPRPIAMLYENTTIIFADMVGFTSWSSKRQPVQVFELLETVYKAFDAIAVRRRVFKVETIGDCYVAVAGLPMAQPDHAVIMTRFTSDCIEKMNQLAGELSKRLGADTAKLAMRVGLHSGSVTGGVLRGDKSRFQLFGDTMNTASRMESNSMPGLIHVSQETANELLAKGKSNWLTARDDLIVAKGKGEMQTYWVTPKVTSALVNGSTPSIDGSNEFDHPEKGKTLDFIEI